MLNSLSPPRKSLNPEVVTGTPDTDHCEVHTVAAVPWIHLYFLGVHNILLNRAGIQ